MSAAGGEKIDLAVVGAGPGGYVAAIRAAQLGARVVVIDDAERPGGVCLNWGCIPTKALLDAASHAEFLADAEERGFRNLKYTLDFPRVIERSREVVARLGKGIEGLLKKNQVRLVAGRGRIAAPGTVEVTKGKNREEIRTERILVATGSKPRLLPGITPDGERIFTSREILEIKRLPKSLVVLGAGAIGMEFAYFFRSLGTEVTIIEMLERILPQEDPEVSEALAKVYARQGYEIRTKTKVLSLKTKGKGVEVEVEGAKSDTVKAEAALLAFGVVPNTENLFAEGLAPRTDAKGWIDVDDDYRTSIPGIYAIGDAAGAPWLAHVASHEGIVCVERIFVSGGASAARPGSTSAGFARLPSVDYDRIPGCTYCRPEVASVGLTEPAARKIHGDRVRVGRFPFRASGRALAADEPEGFVKLVFAPEGPPSYGALLGAHILGGEATEMIAEMGLALRLEATPEDLFETVHAHPTLAEAVVEAALAAHRGKALHI